MKTVKNIFSSDERFPLYQPYGMDQTTKSYISLDIETGEIDAGYEMQNSTSMRSWNNIELHIHVSEQSTTDEITRIIDENMGGFQKILNGASIEWDGSNYRGKLNDDAQYIYDRLDGYGAGFSCDTQTYIIDDLAEWTQYEDQIIKTTIDDLAEKLFNCDGDDGYYFSDPLNSVDAIKSALLDIFAECLYDGDDITQKQAQALIDAGTCDDSQWMEELNGFYNPDKLLTAEEATKKSLVNEHIFNRDDIVYSNCDGETYYGTESQWLDLDPRDAGFESGKYPENCFCNNGNQFFAEHILK